MQRALEFLLRSTDSRPKVGVVLGSGLGAFAGELSQRVEFPYAEIPEWTRSTVEGHAGKLVFGSLEGLSVAVMAGRSHLYEGYTAAQVAMGVRVLAKMGVGAMVLTNAAGGINLAFARGALATISDHINLQGANPLTGANDDSLGARFPDMTEVYCAEYRRMAREAAGEMGFEMREGVYAAVPGPSYETPAEIRYLRTIGADLVGMSTVVEAIAARHMGVKVLGISCVTNMAAGVEARKIDHAEVMETGLAVRERLTGLLTRVLPRMARG